MKENKRKIEQFNSMNTVNIEGDKIVSSVVVLERTWEAEAVIFMDIKTFTIKKALAEVHIKSENPQTDNPDVIGIPDCEKRRSELKEIPELEGISGYIDGKRYANILLEYENGDKLKYMFLQCINGMIQAETYVYKEREFETPDSYNKYWDKLEENGCRMYSNIAPSDPPWMDYAGPITRKMNLFNRFKRVSIIEKQKAELKGEHTSELDIDSDIDIVASFTDSYHELLIMMSLQGEKLEVKSCTIDFVRAPGLACFSNGVHSENFIGEEFKGLDKRKLIDVFGKSQGCYHVVDIMLDVHRKLMEMQEMQENKYESK